MNEFILSDIVGRVKLACVYLVVKVIIHLTSLILWIVSGFESVSLYYIKGYTSCTDYKMSICNIPIV